MTLLEPLRPRLTSAPTAFPRRTSFQHRDPTAARKPVANSAATTTTTTTTATATAAAAVALYRSAPPTAANHSSSSSYTERELSRHLSKLSLRSAPHALQPALSSHHVSPSKVPPSSSTAAAKITVPLQPEAPLASYPTTRISDLPWRVASLLREWMDAVTKSPVQSVFVGTPSVTLEQFVEHLLELLRMLRVEEQLVLPTLLYIRRVMDRGQFVVCWKNVWRLILASTVVAVKYTADERLFNSDFAKIIGLSVPDINTLELEFLALLNFELFSSELEYQRIQQALISQPLGTRPLMSGH